MSNILVTGSSGFVGRAVCARLCDMGHQVVGLDPVAGQTQGWKSITADVSDRAMLVRLMSDEKVTHILHCGGVSGPMVLSDDPAQVMDINVSGSLNLLQAALRTGVQTFVYCSSVSALGNFYENEPVDDDYPLRPTSTYGCSKAAMDMVLRGLWKRLPLDLCVLRFTSIYGPGRQTPFVVDDVVNAASRGESPRVQPTSDWPYLYIDDAVEAAVAACFAPSRRQLFYYIAYPEQVTLDDFAAAASPSGTVIKITADASLPAASRGSLDLTPARRDFGFSARIDHREGVRRMLHARPVHGA